MAPKQSPESLKQAAENALEAGDFMTSMDLFAEAAEVAWEQGLTKLADDCGKRVSDVIALIAESDQMQFPSHIKPTSL